MQRTNALYFVGNGLKKGILGRIDVRNEDNGTEEKGRAIQVAQAMNLEVKRLWMMSQQDSRWTSTRPAASLEIVPIRNDRKVNLLGYGYLEYATII